MNVDRYPDYTLVESFSSKMICVKCGRTPGTGSAVGGHLPGALGIKAGDRVIELRGAASVGDDRGNFKAALGIPF
jgi:hypothetical protein